MRHLATTETQSDLHLVAIVEKLEDVAHFDVVIIGVRIGTEFDFLHLNDLLLLARLGLFFLGFVLKFPEIHDLTDRRGRIGRDFDEIEPYIIGHLHGAGGRDDTDIFAFGANQAYFI